MQWERVYKGKKSLQERGREKREERVEPEEHHLVLRTWTLFIYIASSAKPEEELFPYFLLLFTILYPNYTGLIFGS